MTASERAAERIYQTVCDEHMGTISNLSRPKTVKELSAIIAEEDADLISALREALYRFPHSGHCDNGRCLCDANVQRWRAALAHAEGK